MEITEVTQTEKPIHILSYSTIVIPATPVHEPTPSTSTDESFWPTFIANSAPISARNVIPQDEEDARSAELSLQMEADEIVTCKIGKNYELIVSVTTNLKFDIPPKGIPWYTKYHDRDIVAIDVEMVENKKSRIHEPAIVSLCFLEGFETRTFMIKHEAYSYRVNKHT